MLKEKLKILQEILDKENQEVFAKLVRVYVHQQENVIQLQVMLAKHAGMLMENMVYMT